MSDKKQLQLQLEHERKLAQKRGKALSHKDIERISAPFYTPPKPPVEHEQKLAQKLPNWSLLLQANFRVLLSLLQRWKWLTNLPVLVHSQTIVPDCSGYGS
ncbi:hypothetical protein SLA2020_277230 [Shorea laevis]